MQKNIKYKGQFNQQLQISVSQTHLGYSVYCYTGDKLRGNGV
jgi:hypothetical protein